MNKKKLEKFSIVYKEVSNAYSDCHYGGGKRNLNFIASKSVSIDTAVDIFTRYVKCYNNFSPDLLNYLKELDENGKVYIAREGSVCIYFETNEILEKTEQKIFIGNKINKNFFSKMLVDEVDIKTISGGSKRFIRLWWD